MYAACATTNDNNCSVCRAGLRRTRWTFSGDAAFQECRRQREVAALPLLLVNGRRPLGCASVASSGRPVCRSLFLRPFLSPVAAAAVVGVALLLGAAPAVAHTGLLSSDPADGSTLSIAPDAVSLVFSEDIDAQFASVTIVGADGRSYQTGTVSTNGGEVRTAVSPLSAAGRYQVGYRVVSEDGHPVQGAVSFTLTTPGAGSVAAAPPTAAAPPSTAPAPQTNAREDTEGGAPVWPWVVGALALVAIGAVAALRRGGRT